MKLEYKTGGRTKHFRGRYLMEPREDVLGTTSPGLARPSPEMPAHLTPLFQSQFRFFFCFVKAKKRRGKAEREKEEGGGMGWTELSLQRRWKPSTSWQQTHFSIYSRVRRASP